MAIATAAVGVAGGAAKFFEGQAMQKRAQGLIDNFEFQELQNPYENQQVSTLGSDLQTEQSNISTAGNVEALRSGGNRALVGGLGRVQAQTNDVNRQIAAGLDEQQKQIDFAKSGQDVRNQDVMENRQSNELAGYGNMLGMGQQAKFGGMTDILNTASYLGETKAGKNTDIGLGNLFRGKDNQKETV
jgi:hypothetical protein